MLVRVSICSAWKLWSIQVSDWLSRSSLIAIGFALVLAAPAGAQSTSEGCGESQIDYADEAGLTPEEKIARMDQALTRSLNRYDECQDEPEVEEEKSEEDANANPDAGQAGGAEGGAAADANSNAAGEGEGSSASTTTAVGDISGDDPGAEQPPVTPPLAGLPSVSPSSAGREGPEGPDSGSASASGLEGDGDSVEARPGSRSQASSDIAGDEPELPPAQQAGAAAEGDERVATRSTPPVMRNGKLPEDIPASDNDSILEAQIRQAAVDEKDPELKKKLWNEYRKYKGLPQVK
jgi:hypothetical protein